MDIAELDADILETNFFLLSSRDTFPELPEFLRGYGCTRNDLVIGTSGLSEFKAHHDGELRSKLLFGRYVLGEWDQGDFVVSADSGGQGLVYYWSAGSRWAVGNSLPLIVREMKAQGVTPHILTEPLAVFCNGTAVAMTSQLASDQTPVMGVRVLGKNHVLRLTQHDGASFLQCRRVFPEIRMNLGSDRYLSDLEQFIHSWRGFFATVSELGYKLNLNLSGGKDSRAVLALLLSAGITDTTLFTRDIDAASVDPKDNEIANALAVRFLSAPAPLPDPAKRDVTLSDIEIRTLHALSFSGVSSSIALPLDLPTPKSFLLTGGAATGSKSAEINLLERVDKRLSKEEPQRDEVLSALGQELAAAGYDHRYPLTSQQATYLHYANHRARFHYGMTATGFEARQQVQPLFSRRFLKASLMAPSWSYVMQDGPHFDLMNLCHPEILQVPFADDRRMPQLASLRTAGRTADVAPKRLQVFGSFEADTPRSLLPGRRPVPDQVAASPEEALQRFGAYVVRTLPKALGEVGQYLPTSFVDKAIKGAEKGDKKGLKNASFICGLTHIV
ncbi:MAG: hypothetical protein ACPH5G_00155 [Pseudooceanicola atlanticus]